MFVLTVDQKRSRRGTDRVGALLTDVNARTDLVRPFERTAGDEVQGVVGSAEVVTDLVLAMVATRWWSVGVGIGAVVQPLPAMTRAGSGPAFAHARTAVTTAKSRPTHLCVIADDGEAASRAQAALDLLAALLQRRTERGAEAAALAAQGLSQIDIAVRLGITKQAVSQRLLAADWHLEVPGRRLAAHLLSEVSGNVAAS